MANLSDVEHMVLEALGVEEVESLDRMAANTGLHVNTVRHCCRNLVTLGLASFGTCYDTNIPTLRFGSGYFITTEGIELRGF